MNSHSFIQNSPQPTELLYKLPVTRNLLEKILTDSFLYWCDGELNQVLSFEDHGYGATFMSNVLEEILVYIQQFGDEELDEYDINIIARRIEDIVRVYFVDRAKDNDPELQKLRKPILSLITIFCPNFEFANEEKYEA